MDRRIEFARDAGRPDRAVAINETNAGEHRRAAGTHRGSKRLRHFLDSIGTFGSGINAEVKSLRIERLSLGEFLSEVVFGNAAIGWDPKVGREERAERD